MGNNTAMEPYRAFIADTLNPLNSLQVFKLKVSSLVLGKLWQMFHYSFSVSFVGTTGKLPTWVLPRFFSAVCSIGSVWWSSYTTKEIPPTEEELKR
jgi:maltose/moltooligosaccharide transporter